MAAAGCGGLGGRRVRRGLVALCTALLLAGCADQAAPFAVPDGGPHERYVAEVLAELDGVHRGTLDLLEAEGAVTDGVRARLAATFTPAQAAARADGFDNVVASGFDGFPGAEQAPRRNLERLLTAGPDVVRATVTVTHPPSAGVAPAEVLVELRRGVADETINPTGWRIAREELR